MIIKTVFGRFKELGGIIDERNANKNLKKRNGAGTDPYQLLKPIFKPEVTGDISDEL